MKNVKVSFGDKKVRDSFYESTSKVSTIFSLVLIFVDIPDDTKLWLGGLFVICLFIITSEPGIILIKCNPLN